MVQKMPPKKHIPPSRKRYVRENPTVSIRLTKDLKELLDEVRGDASYSQFIKQLLLQQKGRIKHVFNEGYKKALEDWQIFVPCDECGEEFPILADSEYVAPSFGISEPRTYLSYVAFAKE